MRLYLFALLACSLLANAGCSSDNFYRGRVESQGGATAQAFHVKDGVEDAVTNRYSAKAGGVATVQTVKPYLTLDGEWTLDQAPAAGVAINEEPGSVVVRPLPPGSAAAPVRNVVLDGKPGTFIPSAAGSCDGPTCALPPRAAPAPAAPVCQPVPPPPAAPLPVCAPPPAAAPPAAASDCGQPVYRGCDGTVGGNRPTPYGDLGKAIPPGSGCPTKVPGVISLALLPPGFLIHVGACFVAFVKCSASFFGI